MDTFHKKPKKAVGASVRNAIEEEQKLDNKSDMHNLMQYTLRNASPDTLRPDAILQLQSVVGNQATQRILDESQQAKDNHSDKASFAWLGSKASDSVDSASELRSTGEPTIQRGVDDEIQATKSWEFWQNQLKEGSKKSEEDIYVGKIMYIALGNPEGFTLNLEDLKDPRASAGEVLGRFTNFCVAYDDTQNSFGDEGLRKVIAHARTKDGYVGGWYEKGKVYFDSVRVYASEYNAIKAAITENQDAYFDLDGKVVRVREERDGPVLPKIEAKLKSLGQDLTDLGIDDIPEKKDKKKPSKKMANEAPF